MKWIEMQDGRIINLNYIKNFKMELDWPTSRIDAYAVDEAYTIGYFRDQDLIKKVYESLKNFLGEPQNINYNNTWKVPKDS